MYSHISPVATNWQPERKKKMANPFIHDFVVMLFVFDKIVSSDDIKKYAFSDLKNMFDNRFIRNKDYFEKNLDLSSSYMFLKKVVDHFYNNSI